MGRREMGVPPGGLYPTVGMLSSGEKRMTPCRLPAALRPGVPLRSPERSHAPRCRHPDAASALIRDTLSQLDCPPGGEEAERSSTSCEPRRSRAAPRG
ncbi:hypothetical protein EYF80_066783 [Liparis tanakae]|uniref:Uncharacterized protein n=1 Tax=Liparis tanakae TaxID=230148 RepID=A0A4Z2E3H0_9TELE|nr:hypothetical protein EYF80_066783 [Liparis tanakae]